MGVPETATPFITSQSYELCKRHANELDDRARLLTVLLPRHVREQQRRTGLGINAMILVGAIAFSRVDLGVP